MLSESLGVSEGGPQQLEQEEGRGLSPRTLIVEGQVREGQPRREAPGLGGDQEKVGDEQDHPCSETFCGSPASLFLRLKTLRR